MRKILWLVSPLVWSWVAPSFGATAPVLIHTTAQLSLARYDLAAAYVDGKAIFAGGTEQGAPAAYDRVDIFDNKTGAWSTSALSLGRAGLAGTSVGHLAIFAGGALDYSGQIALTNRVDLYNTVTGIWSTSSLSAARDQLGAASVGTKAYFMGGVEKREAGRPSVFSNRMDVYDSVSGTWSTLTMPSARYDFTPVVVGTKIILFGGGSPVTDIYDTQSNTWQTIASPGDALFGAPRSGYAAAAAGNKAVFLGGIASAQYQDDLDLLNVDTDTWWSPGLFFSVGYGAGASLDDFALFGGGANGHYLNNVVLYDSSTNLLVSDPRLSVARMSLVAIGTDNRIIFAGGYNGSANATVDIFTLVPEPGALGLSFGGILAMGARRPRRSQLSGRGLPLCR